MAQEKMTVHKALCELKTLDARITKGTQRAFVFTNKHSNTKIGGTDLKAYCSEIVDAYKSATDLMARRDAIKRAVTMSNAVTTVTIGGVTYTVAEAIEMKNHGIPMRQALLNKLTSDLQRARIEAEKANGDALSRRADEYVIALYGNADMKNASDDIKKTRDEFIASQTVEVVDPIKATSEVQRLDDEISAFTTEIDSALSVSNALTELDISY